MTTKIDFYVLAANTTKPLIFACQLLNQLYQAQQSAYVFTASQQEAETMDALLWTYEDNSFVPHQLYQPNDTTLIQIGHEAISETNAVLVNLSHQMADFFLNFKHIIEFVLPDAALSHAARERFRLYRDKGCELNTIRM